MVGSFARRLVPTSVWLALAAIVGAAMLAVPAWSQSESSSVSRKKALSIGIVGPLDGRQFRVGIVRDDADEDQKKRPLEDRLMFDGGTFSSVVCKRYNFSGAPYWVRVEDDRVHFLAELTSPTDGRMLWKGTVSGETLEGTMRWTKKRWYWTIDTEHKIRGILDVASGSAPPSSN